MKEDEQQGVVVHAGFPNPAGDKTLGNLDLHQLLVQRPASTFLFRIEGQAWHELGIFDGDIAVIDRGLDPHKSDIVAWWHDEAGEFALSHYGEMPPDASVWGVVTSITHQLRKK